MRIKGKVSVNLFLRCFCNCEQIGKEEIINRYLALMPLLISHFPEYSFVPITDNEDLERRLFPFEPTYAISIGKKSDTIRLTSPLPRVSMGFGPVIESFGEDCSLNQTFSWMPDPETYESKIVHTLLDLFCPHSLQARLQIIPNRNTTCCLRW
jgi:hypothetical protein